MENKKKIFEKKISFIIGPSRWIAQASKNSLIFKKKNTLLFHIQF